MGISITPPKGLIGAIAGAAALTVAAAGAGASEVRIYNWTDYIDEDILTQFTAETGIEVVYDVFDSNDILETRLLAGNTGFDIVVPSHTFLSRQIQAGVFQKLDMSKLPNAENLWPAIAERMEKFDPENAYSINYMWGTTGLGINVDKVRELAPDAPMDSWDLLFKPEHAARLAECGIHVLNAADEMIPAALNYLGEDPNSKNPEVIAKAGPLYEAVRPHIQKFHNSEYVNALANGDICLAVGYSGDIFQAQARAVEANNGVNVAYVIPREGAQMWFDQMAIPADAPHVEEAHQFLNFIMRPEVIAKASNYVFYANGNLASKAFLDPAVLNDPAIYPDDQVVERLFTTTPYGPREQRVVTRLWTRIATGQ